MSWPPVKLPGQCAWNKERARDENECLLPEHRAPVKEGKKRLEKSKPLCREDCSQEGRGVQVAHACVLTIRDDH